MRSTVKLRVILALAFVLALGGGGQVLAAPAAGEPPDAAQALEPMTPVRYMVMMPPGRAAPNWADYGEVIWQEGREALLVMTPAEAERLVEAGAEIARVNPAAPEVPLRPAPTAFAPPASPDPVIQGIINQVASTAVATYDRQLSGDLPVVVGGSNYTIATRYTSSGTPIQKATQFVGEHFAALGYSVENHVWGTTGTPSTYPNVIAELPGQTAPEEIFIIGAHLDDMPTGSVAPGADDNASGSTAVLVAADILSRYYWGCTLRFALWTGEEQGLYGSAAYAARSSSRGENIRGYLNMDMLGYNSGAPNELNLFAKSSVPGSVEMMNLYANVVSTYGLNLVPVTYINNSMGYYSDNASFWQYGYASIMVIEDTYGDETPYYHTTGDRFSTLNLTYFTDMVKASIGTFAHMTGCLITDAPIRVTPGFGYKRGVSLHWHQTAPNSSYQVWRNLYPDQPYFTPGDGQSELRTTLAAPNLGAAVDTNDMGAAGDPEQNRYYVVVGLDSEGAQAAVSQRTGEFSYALVP